MHWRFTLASRYSSPSPQAIIVTGGNRGIGLAISRQVAQAGGHVAVVYHSSEEAPEVAEKIAEEFNVKTKAYKVDTSDAKAMHELVHSVYADLGPVGGLVANAGVVSRPRPGTAIPCGGARA